MADEQNAVKRIVWGEVFSFPHIFKSFKMAVHPSKLILALAVIILITAGGWMMDRVWSTWDGTAWEGEIVEYSTTAGPVFEKKAQAWEEGKLSAAANLLAGTKNGQRTLGAYLQVAGIRSQFIAQVFQERLDDHNKRNESGKDADKVDAGEILKKAKDDDTSYAALLGDAEDAFEKELEKIDKMLDDIDEDAEKRLKEAELSDEDKEKAKKNLALGLGDTERGVTRRKMQFAIELRKIRGVGIFAGFCDYQKDCLYNAIMAVRYLNFTGGLGQYNRNIQARCIPAASMDVASGLPSVAAIAAKDEQPGLLYYILMSAEGVRWLVLEHWVFAIIFLLWALAVWSFLGGAIYRIAAMHFAREEKISMFQALRFSRQKFFSFLSAPLVPIAVIIFTGLLLMVGGLIGGIPSVGTFIMAVLFGIAILMGIGIAFMIVGLVGGAPLLYPTIAVEGSDSFDAISRSFSYIFARPFRAAVYGIVAAVYGTITYLFVRLFAYLALASVHGFVKWGVWSGGASLAENADQLDVLWPKPTFWNLYQWNGAAMSGWDKICALVIGVWVLVLVGLVAAYVITFFISSTTAAYYILRRRVDATDLDDVYIEEEQQPEEAEEQEDPAGEAKDKTPDNEAKPEASDEEPGDEKAE